jgi:glutaredoxin
MTKLKPRSVKNFAFSSRDRALLLSSPHFKNHGGRNSSEGSHCEKSDSALHQVLLPVSSRFIISCGLLIIPRHSRNVKDLFRDLAIPYNYTDLDLIPNGNEMQNYLTRLTNQKTGTTELINLQKDRHLSHSVPNVFINQNHIGGEDG